MKQQFYLVWNEQTGYTKHKHQNLTLAEQEAERLARQHRGTKFFVLSPVCGVQSTDIVKDYYKEDLPF